MDSTFEKEWEVDRFAKMKVFDFWKKKPFKACLSRSALKFISGSSGVPGTRKLAWRDFSRENTVEKTSGYETIRALSLIKLA